MKLTAKITAVLLALMMVIPSIGMFTSYAEEKAFTDLDKNSWYYSGVMWALENGYFSGTSKTTFSPNNTLTRAQLVTVFSAFDNTNCEKYKNISNFSDVSVNQYYTGAVEWARLHEIVSGTGKGKFSPDTGVSREQFCVMLYAFVTKYLGYELKYVTPEIKFKDSISSWAKEAVTWAQRCGLVSGTSANTFSADAKCTRAMAALIIKKTYEAIPAPQVVVYYNLQATFSNYEAEYIDVFNIHPANVSADANTGSTMAHPFTLNFTASSLNNVKNRILKKNPDAKFIFTVANGNLNVFESWLRTDANCKSFADAFTTIVKNYDFDGVDIDYEFPQFANLRSKFVSFASYLREDLDALSKETGKKYTISLAVPAGTWAFSLFDIEGLEPYVDWFNIMNYDLYCGTNYPIAHHHTPPYDNSALPGGSVCSDIALYKERGIPAAKINPGCGMYARCFNNVERGENGNGLFSSGYCDSSNIHYSDILGYYEEQDGQYVGLYGWEYYWDDVSKAPFLYNPTAKQLLTFDNKESVSYKADLAKKGLCGGMMVFDYCTCDGLDFFTAMNEMLQK